MELDINILDQFNINLFETDSSSDEEDNDINIIRREKRYVRDAINPFTAYHEDEFRIRYRFSKESVMHGLLPLVIDGLTKPDMRGLPIEPIVQLLICLRFYATGSFQVSFLYYIYLTLKTGINNYIVLCFRK